MSAADRGLFPLVVLPSKGPRFEGRDSLWIELLDEHQCPVPVVLQERDDKRVFVRRPRSGEEGGRVEVGPGDEVFLVTPVAGLMLSESPEVGDTAGTLFWRPIREIGREGNRVLVEMVGPDESPPKRPVYLGPTDQLVFPQGSIALSFAAIDAALNPEGPGYRPMANAVWTWMRIQGGTLDGRTTYLVTAAQRLDLANGLLTAVRVSSQSLGAQDDGPNRRSAALDTVVKCHMIVVLLYRALEMLSRGGGKLGVRAPSPKELRRRLPALRALRNAIEHAEEHALAGPFATPFDWEGILTDGKIYLQDHSFDIFDDTEETLAVARSYLAELLDARPVEEV